MCLTTWLRKRGSLVKSLFTFFLFFENCINIIIITFKGNKEWVAALPVEEPVQTLCVKWKILFVGSKNGKITRYSCVVSINFILYF